MSRESIQKAIRDQYIIGNQNNLFLELATGFGKSYLSLMIAQHYNGQWLVLCKEKTHIENWKKELKKHKLEHLSIEFYCYASMKKALSKEYIGIIYDECPALLSDARMAHHKAYHSKYPDTQHIFLSAPIESKQYSKMVSVIGKETVLRSTYTLQHSVELGILPTPSVQFVYREWDNSNKIEFEHYCGGKKKALKGGIVQECSTRREIAQIVRSKPTPRVLKVTLPEEEYYNYLCDRIVMYRRLSQMKGMQWAKFKYLNFTIQRKRFIASLKKDTVAKIVKENRDKKMIVFTGGLEMSAQLSKSLGGFVIDSSKSSKEVKSAITKFDKGRTKRLYAVKMGRESLNLKGIEAGIITQLDNQTLSFIQMLGRTLRAEEPEAWVIIQKGSKDMDYASKILNTLDPAWVKADKSTSLYDIDYK